MNIEADICSVVHTLYIVPVEYPVAYMVLAVSGYVPIVILNLASIDAFPG